MKEKIKPVKHKKQSISVEPYPYRVTFVVTEDVDGYVAWKFPDLSDSEQLACHAYRGGNSWIILPEQANIGIIVHEVWHCVRRIMVYINAELENEVVAYNMGWMTDKVVKFLWKHDPSYGQGYFKQEAAKTKALKSKGPKAKNRFDKKSK